MADTIAQKKQRRTTGKKPIWLYALCVVLLIVLITAVTVAAKFAATKLIVTLNGENEITLEFGQTYTELGASAQYGDKSVSVTVEGQVQQDKLGSYTITYTAQHMRKVTVITRTVNVVDTVAPTIVLVYNDNTLTLPGHEYEEEGFVAEDNYDGDITGRVERTVLEDKVVYKVSDSSGNTTEVYRPIRFGDVTPPQLTLLGDATIVLKAGQEYVEPGFTATDNLDGDITDQVTVSSDYNRYQPGTYTVHYTVTDSFGNETKLTRTIVVEKVQRPSVVEPNGNVIYLTFDDGPSSHTARLLEVLNRYNVKATFFVVGSASMSYLDDIVAGGHAIGIHCNSHDYEKVYASEEAYFNDLYTMQNKIYEYTGVWTTLMRFPGGSSNRVSKTYCPGIMTALTSAVEAQGFQYFDWNVDSKDAGGAKTADEVFNNVINGVKGKKYSIVLQHDIWGYSVDAVERIILWGLENGYTFEALTPSSPTAHHKVQN